MLTINNLSKSFGGVHAVQDVSFTVKEGNIHSVIGPNGAGKTTLFNLITGVYTPSKGEILLNGENVAAMPPDALARRGMAPNADSLSCGTIKIDRLRREVWRAGQRVVLQPREFELLEQLVRQADQVVSRSMLLEKVWHFHFDPQTNIVESHMSRLRQKLNAGFDQDPIQTVRGVGYRLRSDV